MKKKSISSVFILALLLVFVTMLVGCQKGDKPSSEVEGTYAIYQSLEWNEENKYKGELSLPEDAKDSFKDLRKEDFSLVATKYDEGNENPYTVDLRDFTITKIDNSTFRYEFSTPFNDDLFVQYALTSISGATKKNGQVAAVIGITKPDIFLTGDVEGAYYGSSVLVLNLKFGDSGKFVQLLSNEMFDFQGLDVDVEVTRIDDKQVKVVANNIPEDITSDSVNIVVHSEAIDSVFAEDIELSIDYSFPYIMVENSDFSLDKATNVLTIEKMYLPQGITGVNGGLFVVDDLDSETGEFENYAQILSQDYNESENYYSVSLQLKDSTIDTLRNIVLNCKMKLFYEDIDCLFAPYYGSPYLHGDVQVDEDNSTVTFTLDLNSAKFANDITIEDIEIEGATDLSNFTLESVTDNQLVIKASFNPEAYVAEYIYFSIFNDKLTDTLTDEDCTIYLGVSAIPEGRVDWSELGESIGKSAGSAIASAAIEKAVLPFLFDFLEIDMSDPEINNIKASIKDVRTAINDLSHDLVNLKSEVKDSEYRSFLESVYIPLENKLNLLSKSLLDKNAVIEYVKDFVNDENIKKYQTTHAQYEQFRDYFREINYYYYNSDQTEQQIKLFYRYLINNKNQTEFDLYYTLKYRISLSDCKGHTQSEVDAVIKKIVKFSRNCSELVEIDINLAHKDEFVSAVEQSIANLGIVEFVPTLTLFGNYLTNVNGISAVSTSVVEKYFSVCDTMYNFESQTLAAKKSFLTIVQYIYYVNAVFAKQMLIEKGEKAIADELEEQMVNVSIALDPYWKQVEAMEKNKKSSRDRLLVCSVPTYVSKSMFVMDPELGHATSKVEAFTRNTLRRLDGINVRSITIQNIKDMCERAEKRKMTLAEDLVSAGFTNVLPNSTDLKSTNYVYCPNEVVSTFVLQSTWKGALTFFGRLVTEVLDCWFDYRSDLVSQSNYLGYNVITNSRICVNYVYDGVKGNHVEYEKSYTCIMAFRAA